MRLRHSGTGPRYYGDAIILSSSHGCTSLSNRKAPLQKHQGSNLTASVELTWDSMSWRVASVWLIICALCLPCLLACLTHLCFHLSATSCASWMSSYSNWALVWLASHSVGEGSDTKTLCLSGSQHDDSLALPTVWMHPSRCGGGANIGPEREITSEGWCSSSKLPPLYLWEIRIHPQPFLPLPTW